METDDAERQPDYLWQKRETQVGRPVFLEGVLRCILRRCKLLEQGRRKEGKTGAEEKVREAWGETLGPWQGSRAQKAMWRCTPCIVAMRSP